MKHHDVKSGKNLIDKRFISGNDDTDAEDDVEYYDDDEVVNELQVYSDAREDRRRKIGARRKRIGFSILFALIAVLVFLNWNTFAPQSLSESVQSFISGFGKSQYPVVFEQGSLKSAVRVGSNVGILTDTSFLIYSQNGKQLASRPHGFIDPAAVSCGNKAVIYDRGGKQFRVESRFGEPFTATTQNLITTVGAGSSANFAVVTESEDYLSELSVYDTSYKVIFKWSCAKGRILSASISPNGKRLAAIVTGARNGAIFSDIYIFNLNSTAPEAVKQYNGEMLFSIRFKDDSNIAAVGESKSEFLNVSGSQNAEYSYGDKQLNCSYNADNGPVVLIFSGVNNNSAVVSLDGQGKELGKSSVNGNVVSATAGDNNIVLVSHGQIWHSSYNCTNSGNIQVTGDILSVIAIKKYAFLFGTQSIGRYNVN